jgi:anti-sigma regulatory factor (Ser/Thr protein kinase)
MRASNKIRDFILDNAEEHPESLAHVTMEQFGVSRQVVSHHIRNLIREGLLVAEGKTRQRTYQLKPIVNEAFPLAVDSDSTEQEVWTQYFAEYFKRFSENTNDICNYGFTEIFNNAVDHSEGSLAVTGYTHLPNKIRLFVSDDGVGIFNKITRDLKLADNREAILELSKGKITTDPQNHTGEGIFFTTRMFDKFSILSGNLYFSHTVSDDWLIEHREDGVEGTYVRMEIDTRATRTIQETFDKYSGEEYDFGFRRTHVPVLLAKYGEEKLVSRSQAKRILARFDRFDEVLLDFAGVDFIGQAFADELFRVYRLKNPKTKLLWIRANSRIESTIRTIMGGPQSNQLSLNLDGPQSPNNNS